MGEGTLHNDWRAEPVGPYLDGRIRRFILDLTAPEPGERVLDIGCGRGGHLDLFRRKGCDVTGTDSSPSMIEMARQRLEHRAGLHQAPAEDLPFSDNEFDIVTLIASLEFTDDPARAIAEAIRVCRGRIFIGVMNRYSLLGAQGHLLHLLDSPPSAPRRHFHLAGLTGLIRRQLSEVRPKWGSVIFLPWFCYHFATGLEERIPVMKNPFGAFLGLSCPVSFSLLTIQEAIREPIAMTAEGRGPVTEIARRFR